ncbi:MAG: hypothetical protein JSR33_10245 [Proteobacteria bacterium]|nr:hypothetical protein [Pseudomonadota bacterium]
MRKRKADESMPLERSAKSVANLNVILTSLEDLSKLAHSFWPVEDYYINRIIVGKIVRYIPQLINLLKFLQAKIASSESKIEQRDILAAVAVSFAIQDMDKLSKMYLDEFKCQVLYYQNSSSENSFESKSRIFQDYSLKQVLPLFVSKINELLETKSRQRIELLKYYLQRQIAYYQRNTTGEFNRLTENATLLLPDVSEEIQLMFHLVCSGKHALCSPPLQTIRSYLEVMAAAPQNIGWALSTVIFKTFTGRQLNIESIYQCIAGLACNPPPKEELTRLLTYLEGQQSLDKNSPEARFGCRSINNVSRFYRVNVQGSDLDMKMITKDLLRLGNLLLVPVASGRRKPNNCILLATEIANYLITGRDPAIGTAQLIHRDSTSEDYAVDIYTDKVPKKMIKVKQEGAQTGVKLTQVVKVGNIHHPSLPEEAGEPLAMREEPTDFSKAVIDTDNIETTAQRFSSLAYNEVSAYLIALAKTKVSKLVHGFIDLWPAGADRLKKYFGHTLYVIATASEIIFVDYTEANPSAGLEGLNGLEPAFIPDLASRYVFADTEQKHTQSIVYTNTVYFRHVGNLYYSLQTKSKMAHRIFPRPIKIESIGPQLKLLPS